MSQKTIDIQALESILSYIVRNPDTVEITRKVDEMGVLLILKVGREDMGIVIGRNGEMANAIKKYIKKVGQVNNMNIRLRIDEPNETGEAVSDTPEKETDSKPDDLQDFSLN
ncbi:MAG: KH domain-containing protein [Patescibacteria group bacterium]